MKPAINPTTRAYHGYVIELGAAMLAYVVLRIVSRAFLGREEIRRHLGDGWQFVLALSPAFPLTCAFVAVVRFLNRMDELMRRITVDSMAIAAGITALLAASYGLVECPVLPHLSAWWTWGTFMGSWLIVSLILNFRYR